MTLTEKIDAALEAHIAGLIGGEDLKSQEIQWWIELLLMAEDHPAPVKRANFFGFEFITRRAHIREAINYLAYNA